MSAFYLDFCSLLSARGYEVKVISLKTEENYFRLDSGVEVHILRKRNKVLNYVTIFNFIQKEKPAVVISNFSYVNPVVLSSKLLGVQHNIIWFHTLKEQMDFRPLNIKIKSMFMKLSTAIITNSKELAEEVSYDYKQQASKIYNLPFTTSVKSVKEDEIDLVKESGKIYIGCPGRLNTDKNQKILLDTLPLLNNPDIVMVFAGSDEENVIKDHKNSTEYCHQIIYLGVLSKEQMVGFYSAMDLIVLPSLNEAFGLVLIEALAMGKKTLVSNRFGSLGYINHEAISTLSFDPRNVQELTHKIQKVLNSGIKSSYYRNIYDSHFQMENIVSSFNKIIQD